MKTKGARGKGVGLLSLLLALTAACGGSEPAPHSPAAADPHHSHAGHAGGAHSEHSHAGQANGAHSEHSEVDREIQQVAAIHGGAGPWAVAGYRMGKYAMRKLGLERQSFDLEVTHQSPREVQYSCIADGAAAATGASLGKLNLSLAEADAAHVQTTYRRKSTGQSVTLKPTAAFAGEFRDVPRDRLMREGYRVMQLRDEEIFEEAR